MRRVHTNKLLVGVLATSIFVAAMHIAGCSPLPAPSNPSASSSSQAVNSELEPTSNSTASSELETATTPDASLEPEIITTPNASLEPETTSGPAPSEHTETIQLDAVPAYSGTLSIEINGNVPTFTEADRTRGAFEEYSELDELGRAGVAFARISRDTMPTQERTEELTYKPTGWQVSTYDFVEYHYLYNRCHLIAWSLAAEGNNPQNLITGTHTLNMEGMRPFEEQVSSYVYRTNNSVLYRVTPIYWADNLVASGVHMEAESVEDGGAGLSFNVYCYNVEPGVAINYATGENQADDTKVAQAYEPSEEEQAADFVINKRSRVYHYPDCESAVAMRDHNKAYFQGTLEELQAEYPTEEGYRLCNICRENHGEQ